MDLVEEIHRLLHAEEPAEQKQFPFITQLNGVCLFKLNDHFYNLDTSEQPGLFPMPNLVVAAHAMLLCYLRHNRYPTQQADVFKIFSSINNEVIRRARDAVPVSSKVNIRDVTALVLLLAARELGDSYRQNPLFACYLSVEPLSEAALPQELLRLENKERNIVVEFLVEQERVLEPFCENEFDSAAAARGTRLVAYQRYDMDALLGCSDFGDVARLVAGAARGAVAADQGVAWWAGTGVHFTGETLGRALHAGEAAAATGVTKATARRVVVNVLVPEPQPCAVGAGNVLDFTLRGMLGGAHSLRRQYRLFREELAENPKPRAARPSEAAQFIYQNRQYMGGVCYAPGNDTVALRYRGQRIVFGRYRVENQRVVFPDQLDTATTRSGAAVANMFLLSGVRAEYDVLRQYGYTHMLMMAGPRDYVADVILRDRAVEKLRVEENDDMNHDALVRFWRAVARLLAAP